MSLSEPLEPMTRMPQRKVGASWARTLLHAVLRRIETGYLELIEADETRIGFGDANAKVRAEFRVLDESVYWQLLSQGSWGLGWSFVQGKWWSPSPYHVNVLLLMNEAAFRPLVRFAGRLSPQMRRVENWSRRYQQHSSETREEAIGVSYDVGNDFFHWMLGPSMVYTGGIWERDGESLEQAQDNKMRIVTEKANIEAHHSVLDIGCGWGSLCHFVQRRTGAKVTGISLSANQLAWAREHAPGCEFRSLDYRELEGRFDRIVSVGMAEHVGRSNFPEYLAKVCDLLAPGGRFVLDTMLSYEGLLMASNSDRWTSFASVTMPNADVPSMTDITRAAMATGELRVLHTETFGLHYARTCREWQRNLKRAKAEVCRAYSEEIYRIYAYSWDLARAALETGMTQVQIVLERTPYGDGLRLGRPDTA